MGVGSKPGRQTFSAAAGGAKVGTLGFEPPTTKMAAGCITALSLLGLQGSASCCLGPHLPLTKNPNCVYLSDCLLDGSGTDWLTVNLSSSCTAEGNRILVLQGDSQTVFGKFL